MREGSRSQNEATLEKLTDSLSSSHKKGVDEELKRVKRNSKGEIDIKHLHISEAVFNLNISDKIDEALKSFPFDEEFKEWLLEIDMSIVCRCNEFNRISEGNNIEFERLFKNFLREEGKNYFKEEVRENG